MSKTHLKIPFLMPAPRPRQNAPLFLRKNFYVEVYTQWIERGSSRYTQKYSYKYYLYVILRRRNVDVGAQWVGLHSVLLRRITQTYYIYVLLRSTTQKYYLYILLRCILRSNTYTLGAIGLELFRGYLSNGSIQIILLIPYLFVFMQTF